MSAPERGRSRGRTRRLVALLAVLTLGPLLVLAFFAVRLSGDAARRQAERQTVAAAEASAVAVEQELVGLADVVNAFAKRPTLVASLGNGDPATLDRELLRFHLSALVDARSGVQLAFVTDPKGALIDVLPDTPSIVGQDFSFRDWYRGVIATDGPYVSEVYKTAATGHPLVVAATAPIHNSMQAGNPMVGILAAAYRLDTIQQFVDDYAAAQGVELTVTDQRGVVVATPGDQPTELVSRRRDAGVTAALAGASGTKVVHRSGESIVTAHAPVPRLGWTITAEIPTADALRELAGLRATITALTVMLALVLVGVLAMLARDVNRRQEANADLERARLDAQQANRAKSAFLSRMSHELRTPLNSVLGFGQLLQLDHLDGDQRDSVEQITKAGRHLLGLIDEVLDLSRVEAGELRLSLEAVDLCEVVDEAMGMVAPLAAARGVTMYRMDSEHPVFVHADRQRLTQVVVNLLANAVKYNRDRGEVYVGCEPIEGGRLRVTVEDTGIGIAASEVDRLFAPFERLGAGSDVEGTGLGLTLTKQLVEAMGGAITVDSELGVGSRFCVDLPQAEPPGVEQECAIAAPAAAAPSDSGERTVLYVEDNLSNVKLLERVVARRPEVTLVVAMQGRIALELALEHRPNLILLDLHLPDVSGEEVLRRLRADARTADTPIVVLSADATPGQVQRLRAYGATDYLTKPFDIRRLLELLDANGSGESPGVALTGPSEPSEPGATTESSAANGAGGEPLDQRVTASLRELRQASPGGAAGIRDLITTFLADSDARVAQLTAAVARGDGQADAVRGFAHSLAGSSASLGARRVAEICRAIEARCIAGELDEVPALATRLVEEFAVARVALRAEFLYGDAEPS